MARFYVYLFGMLAVKIPYIHLMPASQRKILLRIPDPESCDLTALGALIYLTVRAVLQLT